MISSVGRPTRAEIDLSAIRHNALALKSLLNPKVLFCAVVKADAYGHGAEAVAVQALRAGADYLAVSVLDEALHLRAAGFSGPILILGYTPPHQAALVAENALTQSIFNLQQAEALDAAAHSLAVIVKVHLKIDTGMNRLGVTSGQAGDFAQSVARHSGLLIEGIFTHFAKADSADKSSALKQLAAFNEALASVSGRGLDIAIKHCANSAAIFNLPETHMSMVRAGVSLYGLWPSDETNRPVRLIPAMRFKSKIAMLKKIPAGSPVSYGGAFVTDRESAIATLPVGYADGWTRMLSGRAQVMIAGRKAPVIGRICMDQCMADVTGIDGLSEGDDALLFGGPELPVEEIAASLGTINYELLCMVGKRVPRVYFGG